MRVLRVRNWLEFQHYRDRRPPWIKLHFRLLSSKDWVMLNDAERVLAIACMLLASQSDAADGQFEEDPDYIKRVAYLNSRPNFERLIKSGFLEVVKADASEGKQMLADARPETEGEKETETEDSFNEFWLHYPRKVAKPPAKIAYRKALTKTSPRTLLTAVQRFASECAGKDPEFVPHAATWLNAERWGDEPKRINGAQNVDNLLMLEAQRVIPKWLKTGIWDPARDANFGTEPGTPGCRVPPHLLAEFQAQIEAKLMGKNGSA